MPWVKRSSRSFRPYWILGILAGVIVGVLIGYDRWGSTAEVVTLVEKELAVSHDHISVLEKKVAELELKVGIDANNSAAAGEAVPRKTLLGDASYQPMNRAASSAPQVDAY